ncbi:MAG: DUF1697 domain-containing protein, partial [Acidimicrobiales bacterium]
MTRYVALLRGINVGGHNKIPMAELRATLEKAGLRDVTTYIQSGNVALTAPSCNGEELSRVITEDFGITVPVIVRTGEELAAAIAANPFPDAEAEPKRLMVHFCSSPIPADALDGFDHANYGRDRAAVSGGELYVAYDLGAGSSKLT